MEVDDTSLLMFNTIKEDFAKKQEDLAFVETKISNLISVDGILLGLILSFFKLSTPSFSAIPEQVIFSLSIILLSFSVLWGVISVIPRNRPSEIRIEEVLDFYTENPDYDEFIGGLGEYIVNLTKSVRELLNIRIAYVRNGWLLTMISLILLTILIFLLYVRV